MIDKHGPLLTLAAAAKLLNRSTDGFRVSLSKRDAFSIPINKMKLKIGRRVYFPTDQLIETVLNITDTLKN